MDQEPTTSSEVAIVGAGPIGLELAVALKRLKVDYTQFEARQIGYTISWWPRSTSFFSTTERIEIAGIPAPTTTQQRLTGEEYLAYLRAIVEQHDLPVRTYEPVTGIERISEGDGRPAGFLLHTQALSGIRRHYCRYLVLATGDMHGPNRLGIPGEDLPHVSHYFHDPHPYFRQKLMIVGGRNSAAEAALRCWRAGAQVSISYRRSQFDEKSVKHWILPDLLAQIETGSIQFHPDTLAVEIRSGQVVLERCQEAEPLPGAERYEVAADFVLLLTGFTADMSLMEKAGIQLEGAQRVPRYNPDTMETNVPGLYLAGTAAAGSQKKYTLFIENTHVHVGKIVKALTGKWPAQLGTVPARQYDLPLDDIQAN